MMTPEEKVRAVAEFQIAYLRSKEELSPIVRTWIAEGREPYAVIAVLSELAAKAIAACALADPDGFGKDLNKIVDDFAVALKKEIVESIESVKPTRQAPPTPTH